MDVKSRHQFVGVHAKPLAQVPRNRPVYIELGADHPPFLGDTEAAGGEYPTDGQVCQGQIPVQR